MKPTIIHFDAITGEKTVREMTDSEYAQHLLDVEENKIITAKQAAEHAAEQAKAEAKKAAKAEALAALGLSQEVVNLLAE
jgi:Fe2+ or Zn2+ uptake regulation protein